MIKELTFRNFTNDSLVIIVSTRHISWVIMFKWLIDNVGQYSVDWCSRYHHDGMKVMFRTDEDMTMFKLRFA